MSESTIEYKNSPNESTAYAVSEGQKTKVQLVATPAGDLELADNPNVDTGYLVINGEKHKCALVAEVDGELKLPTSATDDTGYVTTQDGRQHKVRLVANVTGGGAQINNQDINVTQNGIYQAEEGYTGLGTVNVNVASGSPTQKFGVTVDSFLGDVDADGNYAKPTGKFELNLSGVKSVPKNGLAYVCYYSPLLTKVIGNEIVTINDKSFSYAFYGCSGLGSAEFNSIETIENAPRAFESAFFVVPSTAIIRFLKLKKVASVAAFANAFKSSNIDDIDKVFPVLEEISEKQAFQDYTTYKTGGIYTFSKVKKITGDTDQYGATFGGIYVQNTVWHFPSATEFTGYIWNVSASYAGEIHFAAANQAAIEACEGYDYKWGFAGATIFFDL